jgi:hypothetical protein
MTSARSRGHRGNLTLPLAAVACCAFATLPTIATAAPATTVIAKLNTQRAAHGLPAQIVEEPAWSYGCRKHNEYQRLNGGTLTHTEETSRPGYSPEGADAASRAVLAQESSWVEGNPWETAPIHLHQLLHPRLSRVGADDGPEFSCLTTHGGNEGPPPAALVTYSYPGANVEHRYEEIAAEDPYTPGQLVGLGAGRKTGPYLYVMVDAPEGAQAARLKSASVAGPEGPVELRAVDNFTPGLEGYLPAGVQLIPVRPLRPSTSYTATAELEVTLGSGAVAGTSRTWTFRTREPLPGELGVDLARTRISGRSLRLRLKCTGGPCDERVVVRWRGGRTSRFVRLRDGGRRTLRIRVVPRGVSVWIDGEVAVRFSGR